LLRLAEPELGAVVEQRYDEILGAVAAGGVDAGLIIHESRFTYAEHGLVAIADLGAWWEGETGLPVPLAGICARADLDEEIVAAAETAIRSPIRTRAATTSAPTRWSSPTRSATRTSCCT
jgi:1,4-dihydroxy-6-naphthoate synthase